MGDKGEERTMITGPEGRSMITFTPDFREAGPTASSASITTPGATEPLLTQSADVSSRLEPESELSPQPGLLSPRTRPQVVSQGTPEVPPLARSPFLETPTRTTLRTTPLFFPEEGSQALVATTPPPTTPLSASFPEGEAISQLWFRWVFADALRCLRHRSGSSHGQPSHARCCDHCFTFRWVIGAK